MRLGIYTDYSYAREGGVLHAEQAFSVFLGGLVDRFDRVVLIGRLNPEPERTRYPVPAGAVFVALPYYQSLSRPGAVLRAVGGSLRRFWRALDDLDAVWLLGPHPLSIVFAVLAKARRRRVFLGVRQDLPLYARRRHPDRRGFHLVASALEAAYRALARWCPTVVVGPSLAENYAKAPSVLEIAVSLVDRDQVVSLDSALSRDYGGELSVLSVGRVAAEKNPLMLADVLARLCAEDRDRWRLVLCGEGPMEQPLTVRLEELGIADRADLRGYVPLGEAMRGVYSESHFLLHTSWTEGLPQVLIEAFAAGVPVVATDVGGIRSAVGHAAELVPPGDDEGSASALRRLADDAGRRQELIESGLAYVREHTLERELDRVAEFMRGLHSRPVGVPTPTREVR